MLTILFFLKAPRYGFVKTRLAQGIGNDRALLAYKALVARQWRAIPSQAKVEVHYAPNDAQPEMQNWLGAEQAYYPQSEGDLGLRLKNAVRDAFARGSQAIVCIGGDCPLLDAPHFNAVEQLLTQGDDVVFGPTEDGGYYLIALKSPQAELFENIPWSADDTLQASIDKAKCLNLKIGLLETLYDVDQASDLERAHADGRIERPH
jgi:rSAM/selenodomain-associated transferase 1